MRERDGTADRIGSHRVVLALVNGGHLFGLVLQQQLDPVDNATVQVGHLVGIILRRVFGQHSHIVATPVCVTGCYAAPIDLCAACVGGSLGCRAVAGQQQGVALVNQLRDEVVADMAVGVGEGGSQRGTALQLAADDQVVALPVGVNAGAHGLHSAVGTAAAKGGECHRVERLHSIHTAEINVLHRANVDVSILTDKIGVVAGADALVGAESVVAFVLVVIAAGDRQGEVISSAEVHCLSGEHTNSCTHKHLGLSTEGKTEFESELELEVVGVAVGVFRAALDIGT